MVGGEHRAATIAGGDPRERCQGEHHPVENNVHDPTHPSLQPAAEEAEAKIYLAFFPQPTNGRDGIMGWIVTLPKLRCIDILPPVPQNVTLFGNKSVAGVIS